MTDKTMTQGKVLAVLDAAVQKLRLAGMSYAQTIPLRQARATIAAWNVAPSPDAVGRAVELLRRYRNETPLGHQPHMIADEADAALAQLTQQGGESGS